MRKLILTISVMVLPLAACGKEEQAPVDPDPTEQVIEEPVPTPEGDTPATEPEAEPAPTAEEETAAE